MGARGILARALRGRRRARQRRPLRMLEIGCGDGLLMLDVARRRGPLAGRELTLLDRQPIVDPATLAAYAACRLARDRAPPTCSTGPAKR